MTKGACQLRALRLPALGALLASSQSALAHDEIVVWAVIYDASMIFVFLLFLGFWKTWRERLMLTALFFGVWVPIFCVLMNSQVNAFTLMVGFAAPVLCWGAGAYIVKKLAKSSFQPRA